MIRLVISRSALIAVVVACMTTSRPTCVSQAASRALLEPVWSDLDGDGHPDEVVIERRGYTSNIALLTSGPLVGQTLPTDSEISSVIAVDIDGDGAPDLIAASPNGSELWLNDGHGVFTSARVPPRPGLSAPPEIEPVAPTGSVAICPTFLVSAPLVFRPRDGLVRARAPALRAWFSSDAHSSQLLRAPPTFSTLA